MTKRTFSILLNLIYEFVRSRGKAWRKMSLVEQNYILLGLPLLMALIASSCYLLPVFFSYLRRVEPEISSINIDSIDDVQDASEPLKFEDINKRIKSESESVDSYIESASFRIKQLNLEKENQYFVDFQKERDRLIAEERRKSIQRRKQAAEAKKRALQERREILKNETCNSFTALIESTSNLVDKANFVILTQKMEC